MKKHAVVDILNYVEDKSQYNVLLKERYINAERYKHTLQAIKQGLAYLGIPDDYMRCFESRNHFVIWLGRRLNVYKSFELAAYIGHKKQGTPIPEGLVEKCPHQIVALLNRTDDREFLHKFNKELKAVSLSPEIFMAIHASLLTARTEYLLPDLLADVERIASNTIKEAVDKVPPVYLTYLTSQSLQKVTRKVTSLVREMKTAMEQELKDIDMYSLRLKEQLKELYQEADLGLRDIIENDVEKGVDIGTITQKTANLFSRLDRLFLGNIYHLKDYEKRWAEIQQLLRQEEEFRLYGDQRDQGKRKRVHDIYHELLFFNRFGEMTKEEEKAFIRALAQELERLHKQKHPSVALLNRFERRGLLSVDIDFDAIQQSYDSFMHDCIVPHQIGRNLYDIVQVLPPSDDQPIRVVHDQGNLVVLALEGDTVLSVPKEERVFAEEVRSYAEMYRKCISILMYDIRGSSYMGVKLQNAAKEQRIKYKFAKEMADIIKRYGGFLLKDTGDGGLIWFGENSESLYGHLYTESVTGRGIKLRSSIFSGAEFELIPAQDSAKRALLCARDLVQRAEEFIRANFMHYREWFADVAERTLELDGITYALLPPEFKSLFRIGVGIASGIPNQDVVFSANSYGDPDLVGPIIADAHLYSMERQPGRSVIICDSRSIVNLIMNNEYYEYQVVEEDFNKYVSIVNEIKTTNHGYTFSDYGITIVPRGVHYLEELDKNKAVNQKDPSEILLEGEHIFDSKRKKIKLLYEVLGSK
jgi:class 3 adenylate cyclase